MRILLIILFLLGANKTSAQTRLTANPDINNCCYTFDYTLLPTDQPINKLEIRLPSNSQWVSYQIDLADGWRIFPLSGENGFEIFYVDQNNSILNFPSEAQDFLSACFETDLFTEDIVLSTLWSGPGTPQRETLVLSCGQCVLLQNIETVCQDSGGYEISFRFVNNSVYPMDEVRISEFESNGLLSSTSFSLAETVNPGDTSSVISLSLSEAAEDFSEFCFYLTGSRSEGELRLDCCTAIRCIELPVCDRCCTDFESFEMDASQGFDFEYAGESSDEGCINPSLQISARALNDCDIVTYSLIDLNGPGIALSVPAIGKDTVQFEPDPGEYEICMRVRSENFIGENCFLENELEICDTLFLECEPGCGILSDFESDLNAGFISTYGNTDPADSCGSASVFLEPNSLNSNTDSVLFTFNREGFTDIDTAFNNTMQDLVRGSYLVCMNVVRYNDSGTVCFQDSFCRNVFVDCISSIRYLDANDHFKIFPNPVSQTLYVEGEWFVDALVIHNSIGQRMLEKRISLIGTGYHFDMSTFPSGMYTLILQDSMGNMYQSKIIVQ
ncbi:MAG: T9SS type A sorting domain-containing protein [Bacteroidota bacterium]